MKREDFEFRNVKYNDGHIDYWFFVKGETKEELNYKYGYKCGEMCMFGVDSVVYSKDEDVVGVKRQFHWNYDVVISYDKSLKELLKSIVQDIENEKYVIELNI